MKKAIPNRIAAIDIGTNSILLLVADIIGGELHPLLDDAVITRLGKGVDKSKELNPEAVAKSLEAVSKYADTAKEMGASRIIAAGTSALRDAQNGEDFLGPAKAFIGDDVRVIGGKDEARFSWQSAINDPEVAGQFPMMMADVGGGSTELVAGDQDSISLMTSIDMGAVRLTERLLKSDPFTKDEIAAARGECAWAFREVLTKNPVKSLVGIGGTVVNLACIALNGADHRNVNGANVTKKQITQTIDSLGQLSVEERKKTPGLEPARADVIVAGAIVFETLLDFLNLEFVTVSIKGARYGMALEAARGLW